MYWKKKRKWREGWKDWGENPKDRSVCRFFNMEWKEIENGNGREMGRE